MFVGIRELRSAKGRFALITVTVALVALLVSFLSGLTGGLEHRNIAALDTLGGTSAVVSGTGDPSLDRSALTDEQIGAIAEKGPFTSVAFSRSTVGEEPVSVAAVSGDRPEVPSPAPGEVIVSSALAETAGITTGDSVDLWGGTKTVAGVSGDDWYSHQPLMWANGAEWAAQPQAAGQGAATTVISDAPADALEEAAAGTTVVAASDLPETMSAYKAENTTLTTINWMLMAIAALVTGAFFTVWTVQRIPDIATLKALGATTASLMRDALGQAFVVLVIGVGVGLAITVAAATAIGSGLPFVLTAGTTVFPAIILLALGLAGAGAAMMFIRSASPLSALGGAR